MNTIFQKNIEALSHRNKKLADKILLHIFNEVPSLENHNGAYNLKYKNHFLHNEQNPLGEAQEIFNQTENTPVTIHIIYGIGLGYLFQYSAVNTKGNVVLYESDINILKISLSLVDFSKEISKNNIYIIDNLIELEDVIRKLSNTKNIPLLLSTNGYRDLEPENFNKFVTALQNIIGMNTLDLKYTKEKFYYLSNYIIGNIPNLIKEIPLLEIKDIYKDKTAVVVSAGPTLDRNLDIIKKYRNRFILITVNTAVKTLMKNGITPDFLCAIENYDSSKQLKDLDLNNINFVTEPFSNRNVRNLKFKNIFTHSSNNMPVNNIWQQLSNIDNSEYNSKGTVSYTALNVARILGCKKIILVGQDLAYIDGQCYSKDSSYKDLVCQYNDSLKKYEIVASDFDNFVNSLSNYSTEEERKAAALRRLKNLNSALHYVKSIEGKMIPTESVYAAFIKPLSEFTQTYDNIEFINTSLVGAQIDGFKNINLETALENSSIIENYKFDIDFKYDANLIKNKLNEFLILLNLIQEKVLKLEKSSFNLKRSLKKYKAVTRETLTDLKKLTVEYLEITTNYRNSIYDFITISAQIDIDYEMKMMKNFTCDNIKQLSDKIDDYVNLSKANTDYTIKTITNIESKL